MVVPGYAVYLANVKKFIGFCQLIQVPENCGAANGWVF